jgi:hypothetical protein
MSCTEGLYRFLHGCLSKMAAGPSALAVEAEACRDGVRLVVAKGIRRVVIETDSLELVSLWKNRRQQRSEVSDGLRYL